MPISNGQRLGSYIVLDIVNVGGMGEVYRGRDTRLNREVAIKMVDAFVSHPERLRWFERESKTLAALSHPNILTIFEMSEPRTVSLIWLRSYFVARRCANIVEPALCRAGRSSNTVRKLLRTCCAADGKNVIHCDLKPENIFVTADDQIEILDFGLAKPAKQSPDQKTTASCTEKTETTAIVGRHGELHVSGTREAGDPRQSRPTSSSMGSVLS